MSGEHDLNVLIHTMRPEMQEGKYVFCTLPKGTEIPYNITPLHIFQEKEGTSIIVLQEEAQAAGLPYQFASRLIILTIHSSLYAIGFLAAVTTHLAEAGISVNAVSAFYHDYVFVPLDRADEALRLLQNMTHNHTIDLANN